MRRCGNNTDIPEVHLYHRWLAEGFGSARQHLQAGGKNCTILTSYNMYLK